MMWYVGNDASSYSILEELGRDGTWSLFVALCTYFNLTLHSAGGEFFVPLLERTFQGFTYQASDLEERARP